MFQVTLTKEGIFKENNKLFLLSHSLMYPSTDIVRVTKIYIFNFRAIEICFS